MEMILVIGFLLTAAAVLHAFQQAGERPTDQLRDALDEGGLIVDVRTVFEYHAGHVPGAVNVPVEELQERIEEIGGKGRPVIVYCQSGIRSRQAASILRGAGHEVVDAGTMSAFSSRNAS